MSFNKRNSNKNKKNLKNKIKNKNKINNENKVIQDLAPHGTVRMFDMGNFTPNAKRVLEINNLFTDKKLADQFILRKYDAFNWKNIEDFDTLELFNDTLARTLSDFCHLFTTHHKNINETNDETVEIFECLYHTLVSGFAINRVLGLMTVGNQKIDQSQPKESRDLLIAEHKFIKDYVEDRVEITEQGDLIQLSLKFPELKEAV
jgi:hypothetical protein